MKKHSNMKTSITLPLKRKTNFTFKNHKNAIANFAKGIREEIVATYAVFFIASILLLIFFNKADLHLFLNTFHTTFLDIFFKYTTFLGDGVMFGVLTVVFFFVKRKMSYVFMVAGVLTLLVTHLFKKIIFKGIPRPLVFFGEEQLHLVEGVKMALWNSFPSGHTMTAFAIFATLCLYFKNCFSQYLWIFLAVVAGVSRVYLSQHFWIDIFVGSFLGVLIAFVSMGIFFPEKRRIH